MEIEGDDFSSFLKWFDAPYNCWITEFLSTKEQASSNLPAIDSYKLIKFVSIMMRHTVDHLDYNKHLDLHM